MGWNIEISDAHAALQQKQHPIDLNSRIFAMRAVKSSVSHVEQPTILEVGCSPGILIEQIAATFPNAKVIGSEVHEHGLMQVYTTSPNIALETFDLTKCPLSGSSVDAIIALNVLEHIEDDSLAARQIFRVLRPGGVAIIEVPASPFLFDAYDEAAGHFRRYRMGGLRDVFQKAGLRIESSAYFGSTLYPAMAAAKLINIARRRRPTAGFVTEQMQLAHSARGLFRVLLALESVLPALPFGLRCRLVATKAAQ
jgi:2-polyprenyl-3-methyl-5-hydroxy-6-metoxy-1,4-benzoquinol methylase